MTFDAEEFASMTFRDKRRIDPETGKVREPAAAPSPAGPGPPDSGGPVDGDLATDEAAPSQAEVALAERTADLQRLQAEYVNYKRRVDRDRESVRQAAVAGALTALLPVLDDIGRARDHGELTGGFKAVAESLERTVAGLGLEPFGEAGDEFDPRIHEALMHSYSDEVEGPVAQAVLQVGYRFGERIVRPARVAVVEPSPTAAAQPSPDAAAPEGSQDDAASEGSQDDAAPEGAEAAAAEGFESGAAGPPAQTAYAEMDANDPGGSDSTTSERG